MDRLSKTLSTPVLRAREGTGREGRGGEGKGGEGEGREKDKRRWELAPRC